MPDSNILAFLFSTVAVLVATLTGLIGAFSTFRLQRMDAKLDFLKDYLLHKEVSNAKTFNQKLRETGYTDIEKIYRHDMAAVLLLHQLVEELDYHQHTEEYEHDILNIRRHQKVSDQVRKLTKGNFIFSLGFVLISVVLPYWLFSSCFLLPYLLPSYFRSGHSLPDKHSGRNYQHVTHIRL